MVGWAMGRVGLRASGWLFVLWALLAGGAACAQGAAERYRAAETVLKAHTGEYDILNDDSREARNALGAMWRSAGEAVAEVLDGNAKATAKEIDEALCREKVQAGECDEQIRPEHDALPLGHALYAVAVGTRTGGTVLVLGPKDGKYQQLWTLSKATVGRGQDAQDLVGAWRAERTGMACRADGSGHKPGSCGPLYADLGLLPPDAQGRARFYIDAGYEQEIGLTIGKQTSVWRWDGDHAELLWIDWYDVMIDQENGTSFDQEKGTLHIGQKGEFRTMFSCGSCIDRPLDERLLLTKDGVLNLGVRSLVPELDRIDDLFWRMARRKSTKGVASAQVVAALRGEIRAAKRESNTIDPAWFSVGMIGASTVTMTPAGAKVCVEADEAGTLHFSLRRTRDGGYFIEHVAGGENGEECASGTFLPLAENAPGGAP